MLVVHVPLRANTSGTAERSLRAVFRLCSLVRLSRSTDSSHQIHTHSHTRCSINFAQWFEANTLADVVRSEANQIMRDASMAALNVRLILLCLIATLDISWRDSESIVLAALVRYCLILTIIIVWLRPLFSWLFFITKLSTRVAHFNGEGHVPSSNTLSRCRDIQLTTRNVRRVFCQHC